MLNKAIELLELEIERIENLIQDLTKDKFYGRANYRTGEVRRLRMILNLLEEEDREH